LSHFWGSLHIEDTDLTAGNAGLDPEKSGAAPSGRRAIRQQKPNQPTGNLVEDQTFW